MKRRALLAHLARVAALGVAPPVSLGCRPKGGADGARALRGRVPAGELLDPGLPLGHRLRDLAPLSAPAVSADAPLLDVVIVGGGVAGLAAAWRLQALGIDALELVELDDAIGGTARGGDGFPWGAHYVTAPLAEDALTTALLDEAGMFEGKDALGHPLVAEAFACRDPDERLWAGGRFLDGLAPAELLDARDRDDFARFGLLVDELAGMVDGAGRPAFALPRARSSTDAELLTLDRISFRAWLLQHDLCSPHLHWLCDYAVRDDDGVSLDDASAWAGLFYFCARTRPGVPERTVITAPDGNGPLVRHLARASAGRRTTGEAAVDVQIEGDAVVVVTMDASGRFRTRRARHVVVATPRFVASRIVKLLREQPPPWLASFTTSAWAVCNVHLRERPRVGDGVPFAWDTVLLDSDSLGVVDATHQTGRDHGPTTWTWYRPLVEHGAHGRPALLALDRAQWADACLHDLEAAFPDVRDLATRVDVCRWGHAMVRPTVGLFSSGVLEAAAAPVGRRIHFAHTDLSGMALFEEALFHGARAADDVVHALRMGA